MPMHAVSQIPLRYHLVADRSEDGRRPAIRLAGLRPASNLSATRFEQVRAISTCPLDGSR